MYTKEATANIPKLKSVELDTEAKALIEILKENPHQTSPPCGKLIEDLQEVYSWGTNVKHRLVYEVLEKVSIAKIVSLWTHYEF